LRVATWIFIVLTVVSVSGVFLPSVELEAPGASLSRRASLSLYQAATNRDFLRRVVAGYQKSSGKRIGGAIVAVMGPRAHGRIKDYVDDAHDAMDTLAGISDDDAKTLGTVLLVTVIGFLVLHGLMGGFALFDVIDGRDRRWRIITAAALALVVAAIAIGIHLIAKEAVAEANDEIGRNLVGLGLAAYAIPAAAVGAFATGLVRLALHLRHLRRT
jgi:hypothetical protein